MRFMQVTKHLLAASVFVTAAGLATSPAAGANKVSGEPGFGFQFIRNHPFVLTAGIDVPITDWTDANANFQDLGLSTVLPWQLHLDEGVQYAANHGLQWLAYEYPSHLTDQRVEQLTQTPGGLGFIVHDEPSRMEMPAVAAKIADVRADHPNLLYMSNALPTYASQAQLYGGTPGSTYTYDQYLDDFVSIIKPDVMMYDHYPFKTSSRHRADYFVNMMDVRGAAQDAGIPYWGWLQGFEQDMDHWRAPSESDIRMQAFTHLAAGYKGLSYFFYDSGGTRGRVGLVEQVNGNPEPTRIYERAKAVNGEIMNLGKPLRFLNSTAVRFVAGQGGDAHTTPTGLTNFTPGAGGDPHILSITVADNGTAKDGLIGFFTDDNGDQSFMLVNLLQGADLTADDAAVSFQIVFDNTVDKLLRWSRISGEQEMVDLTNHTLNLTLPGGTGDLFKYNTGDFVVPEPGTLALLGVGGVMLGWRRRCREA